jgi:integrase
MGRLVRWKSTDIDKYIENYTIPCRNLPPKHDIIVLGGGVDMPKGKRKNYYSFGYGAILMRRRKDGIPRFYLDYRDGGERKRRVIKWAATIDDAVNELKRELAISGKNVQSFTAWAERYKATHLPHLKKPKSEETRLDHLKDWFKAVGDLRQITPTMIDDFRAARLRLGNSRATVNRHTALLKSMLNRAVDESYLEQNPCRKIKQYSERERECMRILTPEEEVRLFAELAEHIKPIVTIALNTGLRLGEIMRLKWSDIDLSTNVLKVEYNKSGKVRYVPISNFLMGVLSEIWSRDSGHASALFAIKNPKVGFKAACRRAEVFIRFHDLRHTAATRFLAGGADIETVRQILGHSSLAVTQKYVHSGIEQAREAVESLPRVQMEEKLASEAVN